MIGGRLPKVTCVTVTTGRAALLRAAVRCYARQTYPNKNMVVVSQGSDADNAAIAADLRDRPDILFVTAPPDLSLGAMRNTSVELSTGDIICQWDDDDLYHPDRVMTQYRALRSDGNRVASAYCDFLKYYQTTGDLYWCDWSGERLLPGRFLSGSVMFHKEMFGLFPCFYPQTGPQSRVEEDLNVVNKLLAKGDIAPVWAGWQYAYVYHGHNTYGLAHHNLALDTASGKKVLGRSELLARLPLIEAALDAAALDREVTVRGLDGIAFTHTIKDLIIQPC